MATEKQKRIREKRFKAGLNNPEKDIWARRLRLVVKKKPKPNIADINTLAVENLSKKLDEEALRTLKLKWYQRIWFWVKGLFIKVFG